ncbi:hypothetical protein GB937_005677 [Aspergillus fischeri]|nr:hypothetical protein GB937_005677 [Aspergillus fischeri]
MACKQQKARIYAYAKFDIAALLLVARNIRMKACSCDELQCPKSGSLNWVIFLTFEDRVEWVFRSPRKAYRLQKNFASQVLASEVATLNYL